MLFHLLDVSLDSSNFNYSSTSVPFVGATLHGYINFAGTPINMAGDIDLEFLKAIENGASLYFILSYQNTNLLKEDMILSKYYSVNYEIWKDEVIERYNELNEAIGDLQTALITGHQFIIAERIPTADELEQDKINNEKLIELRIEAEAKKRYDAKLKELKEAVENGEIDPGSVALPSIDELKAEIKLEIENGDPNEIAKLPSNQSLSIATAGSSYLKTKYTLDDNKLVLITYTKDDGTEVSFILNYNIYDVAVRLKDGETPINIGAYDYYRIPQQQGGGN